MRILKITLLLTFALALPLNLAWELNAQAPPVPVLIPLNIPKEVRLNSLAVDVIVRREPLSLDFSCSYRFENTHKLEAQTISLQGSLPKSAKKALLKRGQEVLDWEKPVEITLEPGSKEVITLQSSVLITGYPTINISYPLPQGFPGKIESIRVTVHLPTLTALEEIVQAEPKGFEFDGFRLTWRWIKEPFPPEIKLSLMVPSLQDRIRELRGKADALSLYEIGTIFRTLAMALPPDSEVFERFYREAVAYLEKARSMDPTLHRVSLDLAALYYHRAFLSDGSVDVPTLALAAREMEEAIKAGAPERTLAWTLQSIYLTLSQEFQKEGLYREAIAYLDKSKFLAERGYPVPAGTGQVTQLKRELSALLAIKFLEDGESQQAISIVNEVLGRDFWEILGAKLPLCRSAKALVKVKPGTGELECSCALGPLFNPQDPDLVALPPHKSGNFVVKINFPLGKKFAPEREEIASRFPVRSDFALCLAALRSSTIEWDERSEFLGKRYFLEGEIDTSEALSLIELELAALRKRESQLASERVLESEALKKLALKILEIGIKELETLRVNSSLELELGIGGQEQRWFIKPGGRISFQREFLRFYPWVKPVVFLLALTAVILMLVLLWKLKVPA
ncbi:MAG: hypothetical protein RMK30_04445 [Anaerolineae bacterium]|nr:hypothetical protein [Anaerolineae bacterium]MDW8102111.1 hypothetical protein [Anaerolineae bacterium]